MREETSLHLSLAVIADIHGNRDEMNPTLSSVHQMGRRSSKNTGIWRAVFF